MCAQSSAEQGGNCWRYLVRKWFDFELWNISFNVTIEFTSHTHIKIKKFSLIRFDCNLWTCDRLPMWCVCGRNAFIFTNKVDQKCLWWWNGSTLNWERRVCSEQNLKQWTRVECGVMCECVHVWKARWRKRTAKDKQMMGHKVSMIMCVCVWMRFECKETKQGIRKSQTKERKIRQIFQTNNRSNQQVGGIMWTRNLLLALKMKAKAGTDTYAGKLNFGRNSSPNQIKMAERSSFFALNAHTHTSWPQLKEKRYFWYQKRSFRL